MNVLTNSHSLSIALSYIRKEWRVVPIPHRSKAPKIIKWQLLQITEAEAPRHFDHLCNIGVILDNDLVDGDLDCSEAIDLAPEILPPTTAIFGRRSKPESHWLYRVKGTAPAEKFTDPLTGEMLLELRGNGGLQTIFPGSVHPSGEPVEWFNDEASADVPPTPTEVDADTLRKAFRKLAAHSLVKRYCKNAEDVIDNQFVEQALRDLDPRVGERVRFWLGVQPSANFSISSQPMNGLGELPEYLKYERHHGPTVSERLEDSLRTVWSPAEQSRLEAALTAIDVKSCGYDDFLKIGFALHSLSWDRPDGTSIGLELWDRWCSQSDHYNQAGLESKWLSFERSARSGVTIGTVFHMAKERGWTGPSPEPSHGQPSASIFDAASFFSAAVEPSATLKAISADELLSTVAPKRSWLVDRFIPAAEVTMIGGDGGTGKTTLALQLGLSCVSGESWLGLPVNCCNVIYVSAEDPTPEVHYRLEQITRHHPVPPDQLKGLKLIDMAGKDAALAFFDKGLLKPTQLLAQIEAIAREHQAGCLIFDAVADFFGGNENERREARAFVGLLRGLAMELNAAVIFLAHPSVDGIKTGRGYSGSTHWNNAVRSRLYFTTGPQTKDDEAGPPGDPDTRLLELAKSNRARRGEQIQLLWLDGRFVVTQPGTGGNPKNDAEADELFLHLLSKAKAQGIDLSHHQSPSFAPTKMAKMPAAKGIGKASLERAMNRLLDQGRIRVDTFGPPSKRRSRLVA